MQVGNSMDFYEQQKTVQILDHSASQRTQVLLQQGGQARRTTPASISSLLPTSDTQGRPDRHAKDTGRSGQMQTSADRFWLHAAWQLLSPSHLLPTGHRTLPSPPEPRPLPMHFQSHYVSPWQRPAPRHYLTFLPFWSFYCNNPCIPDFPGHTWDQPSENRDFYHFWALFKKSAMIMQDFNKTFDVLQFWWGKYIYL